LAGLLNNLPGNLLMDLVDGFNLISKKLLTITQQSIASQKRPLNATSQLLLSPQPFSFPHRIALLTAEVSGFVVAASLNYNSLPYQLAANVTPLCPSIAPIADFYWHNCINTLLNKKASA
jgi:hypothetical protein